MSADASRAPVSGRFEQCTSRFPMQVFSHYAYGDPLPLNARFVGEGDKAVGDDDAITVYARCERVAGHEGKHLARGTTGWPNE